MSEELAGVEVPDNVFSAVRFLSEWARENLGERWELGSVESRECGVRLRQEIEALKFTSHQLREENERLKAEIERIESSEVYWRQKYDKVGIKAMDDEKNFEHHLKQVKDHNEALQARCDERTEKIDYLRTFSDQIDSCRHLISAANNETLYDAIKRLQDDSQGISDHWREHVAEQVIKNGHLENRLEAALSFQRRAESAFKTDLGEIKDLKEKLDRLSREAAEMREALLTCKVVIGESIDGDKTELEFFDKEKVKAALSTSAGTGYVKREVLDNLMRQFVKLGFLSATHPHFWSDDYSKAIQDAQVELERTKGKEGV